MFSVEDMDYLQYIGGLMGVSALTGIAAASAYYYATRPLPEVPLVPLHNQSPILEVIFQDFNRFFFTENCLYFMENIVSLS